MILLNIPHYFIISSRCKCWRKVRSRFSKFKNIIGVFREPNSVIVDTTFLQTLSKRELRSGFAEVIKHCLIKDRAMFDKISKKEWNDSDWDEIVKHSISIKSEVVSKDLKESGLRKILNFGHTIGHAIETTYLR